MQVFRFIFSVIQPFKYYIIGPILLSIFWSIDTSVKPYVIKLIIDATELSKLELDKIYPIILLYAAIQFTGPITWRIYDWCTLKYEPPLKNHIAQTLSNKLLNHSYSFFQNNFTGSLANKINDVTSYVPQIIYSVSVIFLYNFLAIFVAFYSMWRIHFWFSIIFISWVSFFIFISLFFTERSKNLSKNSAEANSKIIGHIVDFLGNISSIRLFGNNRKELKLLKHVQKDYLIASQTRRKFLMKIYSIQGFTFAIYQIGCLFLLIELFNMDKVTAGDFAMILSLNIAMIDNLWELADEMRNFSENLGISEQALLTIYQPEEIKDLPNAIDGDITKGEIIFNQVNFKYKRSNNLFDNKSIDIKPGQKVGLVGYSGSGKSTFVNLILRLFDINDGQILIDNQDIRHLKQESLRKYIATIQQEPSLFHRSIIDNIRYGREEASDEEVIGAAKLAHADEFIKNLPEGYNSLCGEKGTKLSGGQRQRIAIARAILKDAPILILDEATSQLVTITEKLFQESLNHLMKNKTTLVVAHRLSTLLSMDRILVFDRGKIIQDGSHNELIIQNGLYKNLWETQIEGFINDN